VVIGITGHKGSGKSTIAEYLKTRYGFYVLNFADPIKEICKIMFQWEDKNLNDHVLKETTDVTWGLSPRKAMQCVGTEFGQDLLCDKFPRFRKLVGRRIWAEIIKRKIASMENQISNFVIGDVRFLHEESLFDGRDRYLWRVFRLSAYPGSDKHISEQETAELSTTEFISNNDNFEYLYNQIDIIMKKLGKTI